MDLLSDRDRGAAESAKGTESATLTLHVDGYLDVNEPQDEDGLPLPGSSEEGALMMSGRTILKNDSYIDGGLLGEDGSGGANAYMAIERTGSR